MTLGSPSNHKNSVDVVTLGECRADITTSWFVYCIGWSDVRSALHKSALDGP